VVEFKICVEGWNSASSPYVPCSYFLGLHRPREIKSGQRVLLVGGILYRNDCGLFVAVREIAIFAREGAGSGS
jgi:hypothetical protein